MTRSDLLLTVHNTVQEMEGIKTDSPFRMDAVKLISKMHSKIDGAYDVLFQIENAVYSIEKKGTQDSIDKMLHTILQDIATKLRKQLEN